MIRVGVVGHRFFNSRKAQDFVYEQCKIVLKKIQQIDRDIEAISAIAEGADSIFAQVALSLGLPLKIVRPFSSYSEDFVTAASKEVYDRLKRAALSEMQLAYSERSTDAYFEAMQWVIKNADIVVAIWNGESAGGKGGTADAMQFILRTNHNWVHIDISNYSVQYNLKESVLNS